MARSINIQLVTNHDDSDDALRSVLGNLKKVGYLYVDYRIEAINQTSLISTECHAQLVMCEPEVEGAEKLPLPNAQGEPDA